MALATLDTFSDVKEFLKTHVLQDASLDDDYLYAVLTMADILVAREYAWHKLRKVDSSKTRGTSDTYLTAYALPTDYLYTRKINVGTTENEYIGIPFEDQHAFRNSSHKFFTDIEGGNFYLAGTEGQASTIYHYYVKKPVAAAEGATPSWDAPFRSVTAYAAADILAGSDADDFSLRKVPVFSKQTNKILQAMIAIDSARDRASMGRSYETKGNYRRQYDANILTED